VAVSTMHSASIEQTPLTRHTRIELARAMPYFCENWRLLLAPFEAIIDTRVREICALWEDDVRSLLFDTFVCFLTTRNKSVVSGCFRALARPAVAPVEEKNLRLVGVVNAAETTYGVGSKGRSLPTYLCAVLHAIQTC
jgi:hypothetical protein